MSKNCLMVFCVVVVAVSGACASMPSPPVRSQGKAPEGVRYGLRLDDSKPERARVTLDVVCPEKKPPRFTIRRDYAALRGLDRFIANVEAAADGRTVPVVRRDLDTWEVSVGSCEHLRVSYEVFLAHREVFSGQHVPGANELPFIGDRHAFFLGYAVFLRPDPVPQGQVTLDVVGPKDWTASGPWLSEGGEFHPSSVGALLSNYFAVGQLNVSTREVDGIRLTVAVQPGANANQDEQLVDALTKIVQTERAVFGRVPRPAYLIIVNRWADSGSGGSVRDDSIVLNLPLDPTGGLLREVHHTLAHEFFHTWDCSARPAQEGALKWLHEGVTDYFAWRVLEQAGLLGRGAPELFTSLFDRLDATTRETRDSMLAAGERFFSDSDARDLAYTGGALLGFAIDRQLKAKGTDKSLQGFLRHLFNEWCPTKETLSLDDVLHELELYGGGDLAKQTRSLLEASPFPDRRALLEGTDCRWDRIKVQRPRLGLGWSSTAGVARIDSVGPDSPAGRAGLRAGDRLVSVNGVRITGKSSMDEALATAAGKIQVELQREGQTRSVQLDLVMKEVEEDKLICAQQL